MMTGGCLPILGSGLGSAGSLSEPTIKNWLRVGSVPYCSPYVINEGIALQISGGPSALPSGDITFWWFTEVYFCLFLGANSAKLENIGTDSCLDVRFSVH
jgi:hypothetical protein